MQHDIDPGKVGPLDKSGGSSGAVRFLNERLRELKIQTGGLPPHVLAHLRVLVEEEAARTQSELAAAMATLQRRAEERLRKQIARRINCRTVGKAFLKTPAARSGETPNPAQPQASKKAGGAP